MLGIEHVASRRIGAKGEFPGRSAQTSSRRERASETEREQSERQSERQHESQRRCAHATACKGRKAHTSTPAVLLCSCCTHNSYTLLFHIDLLLHLSSILTAVSLHQLVVHADSCGSTLSDCPLLAATRHHLLLDSCLLFQLRKPDLTLMLFNGVPAEAKPRILWACLPSIAPTIAVHATTRNNTHGNLNHFAC